MTISHSCLLIILIFKLFEDEQDTLKKKTNDGVESKIVASGEELNTLKMNTLEMSSVKESKSELLTSMLCTILFSLVYRKTIT